MKLLLSILVSYVAVAFASDVLELTDANFADEASKHDLLLVEFFAPWCGHCKKLAPEYEVAATKLSRNDPPVPIAKVDCTENTVVCGKHGVSGYPTLKIFRHGEFAEDFSAQRNADDIIKTMKSKAGPSSKLLTNVDEIEKFLSGMEHAVIGFFEVDDAPLAKTFRKVADALSTDFKFGHTTDSDIKEKYSFTNDIVLFHPKHLHSKFEDAQDKFEGEATLDKIKTWIAEESLGLCGHRTPANAGKFKRPLIMVYYDVDYEKNAKGTNYWRNRVMKVATKFEGNNLHFSINDKDDFAHELGEFGMEATADKPAVALRDNADKKYVMTDEFSMESLEQFIHDHLDGKLEAYLKSEDIPEGNDEGVRVVVAKNFDEIVNDDTKDVLIEFYAPWCGHCKSLAPKYDELAEKLKDDTDIVLAKMDATANDVPSPYDVKGFPTLYWVPKGKKSSPQPYQGGREVDDFVKFIAKEATDELKTYERDGKKKKVPTATLR